MSPLETQKASLHLYRASHTMHSVHRCLALPRFIAFSSYNTGVVLARDDNVSTAAAAADDDDDDDDNACLITLIVPATLHAPLYQIIHSCLD